MSPSRIALQIWTNDVTVVIQSTDRAHTCATWHSTDEHAVCYHSTRDRDQASRSSMHGSAVKAVMAALHMQFRNGGNEGGQRRGGSGGGGRGLCPFIKSLTEADLQKPVLPLCALNTLRAPPRTLKIPHLHFHNRVYFWRSLFLMYFLTHQVRVTTGDSGCCVHVMSVEN